MNVKEIIRYIAQEDLEINLTFEVSSDSGDLEKEVRQLRKQISELQERKVVPEKLKQKELPASEDEDASDQTEEKLKEAASDKEEASNEETLEEEAEEFLDEFSDEEFDGEGRDPTEERRDSDDEDVDMGPTEKQRTEAGADFEDLFGDV